jgi:hypothetical protein
MSRCKRCGCKFSAWHWRESRGFVFDALRKVFIRTKQR